MDTFTEAISGLKKDFESNIQNFSLEYITLAGRKMGTVSEFENRLEINGNGNASLFRRRGPGDSARRSPGRFIGSVSNKELMELLDVLEASGIQAFRSDTPGPRDPVSILRVLFSGQLFLFSWGTLRPPTPQPIANLKMLLADWSVKICPVPLWSLNMSILAMDSADGSMNATVRLDNKGQNPIWIAHPASTIFGAQFFFFLKYGERQLIEEGVTPSPIDIQIAPLKSTPIFPAQLIAIQPNIPWEVDVSTTLLGSAPRGWTGKICFHHYLEADSLGGVPVFNGALFTDEVTWL